MSDTSLPKTGLRAEVPILARVLTYVGAVPFLAGLAVAIFGSIFGIEADTIRRAVQAYAAIILSFLGGVHWGWALTMTSPRVRDTWLVISVVPSLVALAAFLFPAKTSFLIFAVLFLAQGLFDIFVFRRRAQSPWYPRLRLEVTAAVVVILALTGAVS